MLNNPDLIYASEVKDIVGCAMEVLNTLGHGLLERPYERAMVVEFGLRNISFVQQARFNVVYKGVNVGEYIPDLVAYNNIIIDIKTINSIGNHELGQMLNYLKITERKLGLILNFSKRQLEWKRVVL